MLHKLETYSLATLLFVLWCGVIFSLNLCVDKDGEDTGLCALIIVAVVGTNIFFVGFIGMILMFTFVRHKQRRVANMIGKLRRCCRGAGASPASATITTSTPTTVDLTGVEMIENPACNLREPGTVF